MLDNYIKTQTRKMSSILKDMNIDKFSYAQTLEVMSRYYGFKNYAVVKSKDFSVLPLMQWKSLNYVRDMLPNYSSDTIESWLSYKLENPVIISKHMFQETMKQHKLTYPQRKENLSVMDIEKMDQVFGLNNILCIGKIPLKRNFECGDLALIQDTGSKDIDNHIVEIIGMSGVDVISYYIVSPVTDMKYKLVNNLNQNKSWKALTIGENLLYPVNIK